MASIFRYPFTILWIFVFSASLYLAFVPGFPIDEGYYIFVLALGIPLTLLLFAEQSRHLPTRKEAMILLLISAIIWTFTAWMVRENQPWPVWHTINILVLLVFTLVTGNWIAGEIEKSGHLIPVCILGTLVDIWSVFQGPSRVVSEQIQEHVAEQEATVEFVAPPLSNFLLISWPHPGAGIMSPMFGLGDLVFIALLFAASRRFGISIPKTFLLILIGMILAVIFAFWRDAGVPALPFICGMFLLGNFSDLPLKEREWRLTIGISVFIIMAGLINYLMKLV